MENCKQRRSPSGVLLVTGAAIAWSTAGLFARLIALEPWSMLVWRGLFGALGILAFMFWRDGARGTLADFRRLDAPAFAYVGICTIGMTAFIVALAHTSVAHVAIIYAIVPFCAAGFAFLAMGERPARSAVLASLAALAGVAVMTGFGADGGLTGDLLALGMTLAMALMIVIARRWPGIPTLPATFLASLATGLVSVPFAEHLQASPSQMVWLALFGLINSALGIVLFMIGSRLLPAIESALITALDAPLAPLWVWLAFGERMSVPTLIGGGIVFAAVLALIGLSAREAQSAGT